MWIFDLSSWNMINQFAVDLGFRISARGITADVGITCEIQDGRKQTWNEYKCSNNVSAGRLEVCNTQQLLCWVLGEDEQPNASSGSSAPYRWIKTNKRLIRLYQSEQSLTSITGHLEPMNIKVCFCIVFRVGLIDQLERKWIRMGGRVASLVFERWTLTWEKCLAESVWSPQWALLAYSC